MTSSIPTSAATARAVASLSPVSRTGRRPSARSRATASAEVGLTVSATAKTAPGAPSTAPTTAVAAARLAHRGAAASSSAGERRRSSAGRPATHRAALDDALDAEALAVRERLDRRVGLRRGAAIARAIGCSEQSSSAPTSAQRLVAVDRRDRRRRASSGRVVTVPVLSSTTVSTRRVDSSTSGPLISSPSWAPRPVPTISATGVARPSAHGQAMISTATAAVNANVALSPVPSQKPSVATASAITTGTKTPATRSASRWTGALPDCASVTSLAICASAVSAPTFVARTTSRPPALTVAPATSSPGPTSTGTDSPVSMRQVDGRAAFLDDAVGGDLLARADDEAVADRELLDRHRCAPSTSETSLAPSSSSAVSAAPARRLARASK